ncbi:MAG TPA: hypothetical protein DD400_04680 [Rhodospirillaceae bacterium]|nr:hypothetical protein [Rhodospirillaceae bacterium]
MYQKWYTNASNMIPFRSFVKKKEPLITFTQNTGYKKSMRMKTIKIAQWGGLHIAYMPLYIADRLGLFEAQGLKPFIYHAGNDDVIFDEVAQGRAHFGMGDPVFAALGQQKGIDARVVASLVTNTCMLGITHHAEIKPFSQVSGFVGLRVGTFPRPSTAFTLLNALKKRHKRLLKSMQIVETEIGQQAYLLASNKVDLILELEPMVSMALHQGLHLVCNMGDFFQDALFTGLTTLHSTIEKDPELVAKTVLALQHALTLCRTHPEKAVSIGNELFPAIDKKIMKEAILRMVDLKGWPEQTVINPQAWMNLLKMRQDVGELDTLPPFDKVVDNQFAYAALEK